jgi:hypothetical protein
LLNRDHTGKWLRGCFIHIRSATAFTNTREVL